MKKAASLTVIHKFKLIKTLQTTDSNNKFNFIIDVFCLDLWCIPLGLVKETMGKII